MLVSRSNMNRVRLVRVELPFLTALFVGLVALPAGRARAGADLAGVYVLTEPERTMEQVDRAYAEIPPVRYEPPADRWQHLPHVASILGGPCARRSTA